MAIAKCSECGVDLVNEDGSPRPAGTKTCSVLHRQKRARRLKRQASEAAKRSNYPPELQEAAAVARGEIKDVAAKVLAEELRPIVRESMTADVLNGIGGLIKMQPRAIELLQQQMESDDETIAQRAVTLLLKYTMGNPSVAPPPQQQETAPLQVTFNVPRPGDTTAPGLETAVELRECEDCKQHKSEDEFVGASARCTSCFEQLKLKVAERLGE